MKRTVRITIESVIDGRTTIHRTQGEQYRKGGHVFVRYREPDPSLGRTTTTLKYGGDDIRVVRHGDIEAEQTYAIGRRLRGTYRTAQGVLALETVTHSMRTDECDKEERVFWSYDVYIEDERIGTYALTVTIRDVASTEADV